MKTTLRKLIAGFALLGLLAPTAAPAAPTMADPFLYTEHRSATAFWGESWTLVIGSSNIFPSGAGTSASAAHLPVGSGPDYALSASPSPWFPNLYAARSPYAGQTGQWAISANDGTGTTMKTTHALDDPRSLPLLTGLGVSGSPLAPRISWDPVAGDFSSWCNVCGLGTDFFNYQVQVRLALPSAPIVYQSGIIPTQVLGTSDPVPTLFDLPAGVLSAGVDYLIGVRLVQAEVEGFLPGGGFFVVTENMSTTFLSHTAAIPEPQTYGMLLAGLGLLGFVARRRRGMAG